MTDQRIECICGTPIADNAETSWFKVGVPWRQAVGVDDGTGVVKPFGGVSGKVVYRKLMVTSIELRVDNRGDHGVGWYDVKAGDAVIASLNERNVHELYYEIPTVPADG